MHKSHTIYAEDKNDNQIMQLVEERCAIIFQSNQTHNFPLADDKTVKKKSCYTSELGMTLNITE